MSVHGELMARCTQLGLHLSVDDKGRLHVDGDEEVIGALLPQINRHQHVIIPLVRTLQNSHRPRYFRRLH